MQPRVKLFPKAVWLAVFAVVFFQSQASSQQHLSRLNRDIAEAMLSTIAADLRGNYYDPKLKGIDLEAKVRDAREKIAAAGTMDVAYIHIAGILDTLNDSHTTFFPPSPAIRIEYGWEYQMIGDRCYVTQVKPGSDADAKGIKPGDEVLTLDGFTPTRDSLRRIDYVVNVLSPQTSLQAHLRQPSGTIRKMDVKSEIRESKKVLDANDVSGGDSFRSRLLAEEEDRRTQIQYAELGPELMIVKIPLFEQSKFQIEGLLDKAREHKTLVVDLRGNPGGLEQTLKDWVGGFFEKEVKIADRITRTKSTPVIARSDPHHQFKGKLVVLVDSTSASAAELFARVMQIENRATLLGDQSSGATMESRYHSHTTGINPMYYFGAFITEAELKMSDGQSLEHSGVTPDEVVLPSAGDLAANRDPVLSRAAEYAGLKLDPTAAGKIFHHEWRKKLPYEF